MSHTTRAALGTVFIHNGGYDGDVGITVYAAPEELTDGPPFEHRVAWRVSVPFADLRELVFGYLKDRQVERLEQIGDDAYEDMLLGGGHAQEPAMMPKLADRIKGYLLDDGNVSRGKEK